MPCSFKERLNKFVHNNWIVASSHHRSYDLFLRKDSVRTYICGPYWKSLIRIFDIEIGDVLHFEYNAHPPLVNLNFGNVFNVTVYRDGDVREVAEDTGRFLLDQN